MPSSKIQTPIVCQCPWPTVRHLRHVIQSFFEGASATGSGCNWKSILVFKKSTSKKWSLKRSIRKLSNYVKTGKICKVGRQPLKPIEVGCSTKSWKFKDPPLIWPYVLGENGPQTDSKGSKERLSVPTLCISSSVTAGRVSSLEDRETGLVYKVVVVASRSLWR